MSISYLQGQTQRVRITLDLNVMSDFNAHQIDWDKVFELEPNETVSAYVEDLDVEW
jgi:hypothetical protein